MHALTGPTHPLLFSPSRFSTLNARNTPVDGLDDRRVKRRRIEALSQNAEVSEPDESYGTSNWGSNLEDRGIIVQKTIR